LKAFDIRLHTKIANCEIAFSLFVFKKFQQVTQKDLHNPNKPSLQIGKWRLSPSHFLFSKNSNK